MVTPSGVSERQMELLVEFAESHRDIALGRFRKGRRAVQVTQEAWNSVSMHLNALAEGTTKTPDQWRRFWIDLMEETKVKAADLWRNESIPGGGPNKLVPLNKIEMRVVEIIGRVAVEGLPGVRVPVNIPLIDETEAPTEPVPYILYTSTSTTVPESSAPYTSSKPIMLSPSTETPPAHADTADLPLQPKKQHKVLSRDGHAPRSTARPRRLRPQRQIRRDVRVPRWAYDIEMRRIAAEERHAAALEAIVAILKQMGDDLHRYVHRTG